MTDNNVLDFNQVTARKPAKTGIRDMTLTEIKQWFVGRHGDLFVLMEEKGEPVVSRDSLRRWLADLREKCADEEEWITFIIDTRIPDFELLPSRMPANLDQLTEERLRLLLMDRKLFKNKRAFAHFLLRHYEPEELKRINDCIGICWEPKQATPVKAIKRNNHDALATVDLKELATALQTREGRRGLAAGYCAGRHDALCTSAK